MTTTHAQLSTYAQDSYKDYAMYVLLDRALPRLADGLKPVQRRIVYVMHELGLSATSKPKKSVRTVGDVLGKYHPHSDQACYEALVGLAQPFTTRYPLLKGQGNFGSLDDPKSFAAMRYTEITLSPYAALALEELSPHAVPWQQNFDGTMQEPLILPAKVPFLMLNGCTGIAVGLSTEIPPHNLSEVCEALIILNEQPNTSIPELLSVLKGPDFPCGGVIRSSKQTLLELYETGKAQLILEGKILQEGKTLKIVQIPYYTTTSKIIEQLLDLLQEKALPAFDLLDESDESHPVRVSCHFKSATHAQEALDIFFQKTELRKNYRCAFYALNEENKPYCFDLKTYLISWLNFRKSSLRNQFQARYETIALRLKLIHTLMIVYTNLREIINILQTEDDPWGAISKKFDLDKEHTDYLGQMRLRQLTKLSQASLEKENAELLQEQQELYKLLNSSNKLTNYLSKELKQIIKTYGDPRRTQISLDEPSTQVRIRSQAPANIPSKPIWITLSALGWVKGRYQEHDQSFRQGDAFKTSLQLNSDESLYLFDEQGRLYGLPACDLPTSRYGDHLCTFLNLPSGQEVISLLPSQGFAILAFTSGHGFALDLSEQSPNKRGKQIAQSKNEGDKLIAATYCTTEFVLCVDKNYHLGVLKIKDIPVRRSGQGVLLYKGEPLIKVVSVERNQQIELELDQGKKIIVSAQDLLMKRTDKLKSCTKKNQEVIGIRLL